MGWVNVCLSGAQTRPHVTREEGRHQQKENGNQVPPNTTNYHQIHKNTTKYNEIPPKHNQVPPNSAICENGKGRKLERTMVPSISPMRRRTVRRETENAEFLER